jgi:G3E family GTPase
VLTPSSTPDRIPVNIITGFLGSGKTSAVLNLLKQKPPEEHWAILVNEFGEIGVDRA